MHILRIIRELINFQPTSAGTNLTRALEFFNNIQKKRSTTFILSDFLTKDYEDALRIAKRRHDIIGIHLYDPREKELPNVGLIRGVDAETGKHILIDSSNRKTRERYKKYFEDNYERFHGTFLKTGADIISLEIPPKSEIKDQFYVKELLRFFKKRH